MAKKNNRKCICCAIEYRYCNTCAEDALKPLWYSIYHNENCKDIFHVASDYLAGAISKEDAKLKLETCDMSYKNDLKPSIIKVIDEVYEEPTKRKENKEEIVEETICKTLEPTEVSEVKKLNKKKQYLNGD